MTTPEAMIALLRNWRFWTACLIGGLIGTAIGRSIVLLCNS